MDGYNVIEKELSKMYAEHFCEDNEICRRCRGENEGLCRPVSAWFVGSRISEQKTRVLFVGKNARGFECKKNEGEKTGFISTYDSRNDLAQSGWAYWSYSREIISRLFTDVNRADIPEYTAITNIIKCNNSSTTDTTTDSMKKHCISELQMIRKEIRLIKPTHVIFYTGWYYDTYLDQAFDAITEPGDMSTKKKIGSYDSPWREAEAMVEGDTVFFLRTCHPERKKKEDFIDSILEWIQRSSGKR